MASIVLMASSTSKVSAMISAPSEMRCRSMLTNCMTGNTIASVSGIDKRDDGAGPKAEAQHAHRHDDRDRLPQRRHELADRAADHGD